MSLPCSLPQVAPLAVVSTTVIATVDVRATRTRPTLEASQTCVRFRLHTTGDSALDQLTHPDLHFSLHVIMRQQRGRRDRKGMTGNGYEDSRRGPTAGYSNFSSTSKGSGAQQRPPPGGSGHTVAPSMPLAVERPKLALAPRGSASSEAGEDGGAAKAPKANPFGDAKANDAAKHYAEMEKRKAEDAEKARVARVEKKKSDDAAKAAHEGGEQKEHAPSESPRGGAAPRPAAGKEERPPKGKDGKHVPSPREHAPGQGAGRGAGGRGERGERGGNNTRRGGATGGGGGPWVGWGGGGGAGRGPGGGWEIGRAHV